MGTKMIVAASPRTIELPRPGTRFDWTVTAGVLLADVLTLCLVFGLTVWGRHVLTPTYPLSSYLDMLPCLLLLVAAFSAQGLYPGVLLHPAEEMQRIFISISITFVLVAATTFLWRNAEAYSRAVFLVTWAAGAPLVLLTRYTIRTSFSKRSWWGVPAVVLGSGSSAQRVTRKLQDGMLGVRIVGHLSDDHSPFWPEDLPPMLGGLLAARRVAALREAQYAIIAMPDKTNIELRHIIQEYCQGFSHVLLVPDMPGLCSLGISARDLGGELCFEFPQRLFHAGASLLKRSFDLSVCVAALVLLLPLFLLIVACIKLTSKGTVFYRQTRMGQAGKQFTALKFRTMVPDADQILGDFLADHPECLIEWKRDQKLKNDPRVTRVGKILRRFSLDELPQLLNVIAGQMSLVGPRPIVRAEVEKYGRGYKLYSRVRPGITGLWQVSGRNNTTYEERVALDEFYVSNWSPWLDAYILTCTVKAVLTAEGAY